MKPPVVLIIKTGSTYADLKTFQVILRIGSGRRLVSATRPGKSNRSPMSNLIKFRIIKE
jgi:hypothetical protein